MLTLTTPFQAQLKTAVLAHPKLVALELEHVTGQEKGSFEKLPFFMVYSLSDMPNSPFDPSWKRFEADMHSDDASVSEKAGELFLAEREKALKTDKQAREWEASRKASIAKDKPAWAKKKREEDVAPVKKMIDALKDAGDYEEGLEPAPGYIVIEEVHKEKVTESGIILAEEAVASSVNTGVVVSVGSGKYEWGQYVYPPAKVGYKVLFKWGAGLEITLKNKKCRFMQFSDILGVFTK